MNKKKTKINIILILIVIFLIVTALMVRFEFNPISYLLGGNDDDTEVNENAVNYNGIYLYKESLNKTYKLLNRCTLSYYDFYIVVLNNNYYRYKSTCLGTFLLEEGTIDKLDFTQTLEKNVVIKYNNNEYLKTDYIDEIVEGNYFITQYESSGRFFAENYHILLKETQLPGKEFNVLESSVSVGNTVFPFEFKVYNNNGNKTFEVIVSGADITLYSAKISSLEDLPLFNGFGKNLTIIEPIVNKVGYAYTFKAFNREGLVYDLKDKFPITVDGVKLTYDDSIYIKYLPTENVFVVLVGKYQKFCEENSASKDVAYYVFNIKYNYVSKNFDNPKFIKKVYRNEGCKYVDELMGA